jgi:hypothetical protein
VGGGRRQEGVPIPDKTDDGDRYRVISESEAADRSSGPIT